MYWRTWRDQLALLLLIVIPLLWVGNCFLPKPIPEVIIGATIAGWTLIVQFYFRKKPSSEPPEAPPSQ
jgi:hypothetical protein